MESIDRRTFLIRSAILAGGGLVATAGPFAALTARIANAAPGLSDNGGYGPLMPAVDKTTGEVLLWLPRGFDYRSFSVVGEPMADGFATPGRHDGMAAFNYRGKTRLVRNHEVFFDPGAVGDPTTAYDRKSGGATTTIEVSHTAERYDAWMSLNGTNANCAGGATPWDTWITCEETPNGPDANISFLGEELHLREQHGFLFEVPVGQGPGEIVERIPIRKAGRFAHEAVAVDPQTGIVYETEDDFAYPSGFYRYIPPVDPREARRLHDGGRLQILGVVPKGSDDPITIDLSRDQTPGTTYRTAWIDIEHPDPTFPQGISNDAAAKWVFKEGESKGAAQFSRLEGIIRDRRKLFMCSTEGGGPFEVPNPSAGFGPGYGQVWMYDLDSQALTLVFESPGPDVLDLPDNVAISPRNNTLLMCEDSGDSNYLRGLTNEGRVFDFALNSHPTFPTDEFAGATFSPDGHVLFVNMQAAGITFAIWGPWKKGPL
jgi:uncharacterized protein